MTRHVSKGCILTSLHHVSAQVKDKYDDNYKVFFSRRATKVFSPFLQEGTALVTSFLLSCRTQPFQKLLINEEFAPVGEKCFF